MIDKNKKGFTLVELLVVIAIIGLLSTIAVVSLGSARAKARDTKRIADMKQVATALEQFYADQGGYPAMTAINTTTSYEIGADATKALCGDTATAGAAFETAATCTTNSATIYMGNIPRYPTPPAVAACNTTTPVNAYCYGSSAAWAAGAKTATSYTLVWKLEATNPAAGFTGTSCTTTPNGVTCS